MKRLLWILGACSLIAVSSFGQKRTCSTMQYYEMNKQKNSSLEVRMMEDEEKISDWVKHQPVNSDESQKVQLPSVPGFIPSGNIADDKVAYAKAKGEYLYNTGYTQQHTDMDQAKVNAMRQQKRKTHSFITK